MDKAEEDPDRRAVGPIDSTKALVRENAALLRELLEQLGSLRDDEYAQVCTAFGGERRIGPHCRHIFDHYDAFFRALDAARRGHGVPVDYDRRERCSETEIQRPLAINRIRTCLEHLAALEAEPIDVSLQLRSALFAAGEGESVATSTVARELSFLASHTTHHAAFIGLLLNANTIGSTADFGRAAATRINDRRGR